MGGRGADQWGIYEQVFAWFLLRILQDLFLYRICRITVYRCVFPFQYLDFYCAYAAAKHAPIEF